MTVATNSARFGRVRRTSQTLPCPHLCCVTEGGLQDLGSLAGYGAARMGRAFSVDDPGLVRRFTDAGICCALFACSYPFSSCGLCVSVMQGRLETEPRMGADVGECFTPRESSIRRASPTSRSCLVRSAAAAARASPTSRSCHLRSAAAAAGESPAPIGITACW